MAGGFVLYGLLKKRGAYPLEIANQLEFEANSGTESIFLTNRGMETLTLSELRFDKPGFAATLTLPVPIDPGQTLEIVVAREMESTNKNKRAKLILTAFRPGGESVDGTVLIRVAG